MGLGFESLRGHHFEFIPCIYRVFLMLKFKETHFETHFLIKLLFIKLRYDKMFVVKKLLPAEVAQLVVQLNRNQKVGGSSPFFGTIYLRQSVDCFFILF